MERLWAVCILHTARHILPDCIFISPALAGTEPDISEHAAVALHIFRQSGLAGLYGRRLAHTVLSQHCGRSHNPVFGRRMLHGLLRHNTVPTSSRLGRFGRNSCFCSSYGGLFHVIHYYTCILHVFGRRSCYSTSASVDTLRQKTCPRLFSAVGGAGILGVRFRSLDHGHRHSIAFNQKVP